ncbi:helix-turn-helix protein [Paenibacillus sp. BK033]|uniref:helix-turn-helix domain-containing protein n=1 Tax=Paenibacillus sp. BK033 TaxID=2512133 RepID=UPI0010E470AB|nr:helix-turn-helix transcriptional regulator [Paenibacillus sp. BK033]TCN00884.1 helix-turn-helix protein [Paenibacillus sp. BK033]
MPEGFTITVKAARINCGIKPEDAAKALKISKSGYSKKENGKSRFYVDEIATLSELFKVPVANFFEAECHKMTQPDTPLSYEE